MTFQSRRTRTMCAFVLAVLALAPMAEAQRKRAALHPNSEKITLSGTVTDAVTHQPLKGATVVSGDASATTDAQGHYTLTCMTNTSISASRIGYVTQQKSANSNIIDFALAQTPTVTVKTTDGQTIALDFGTTKFGYVIIFSGYAASDVPNVCRPGEATWDIKKTDIKKITGPAHPVTSSCCDRGPVMAIDIELKNGEKATGFLNDACFGAVVDVFGMERASATAKYFHLTDVAEIDFP